MISTKRVENARRTRFRHPQKMNCPIGYKPIGCKPRFLASKVARSVMKCSATARRGRPEVLDSEPCHVSDSSK